MMPKVIFEKAEFELTKSALGSLGRHRSCLDSRQFHCGRFCAAIRMPLALKIFLKEGVAPSQKAGLGYFPG